jgi:3-deoxy-D-manno-octulosonic-acid transferase
MFLLKYEWEILKNKGGGIEVKNFEELYEKMIYLIENPDIAEEIGKTGYKLILENKGAIEKTLNIINSYI